MPNAFTDSLGFSPVSWAVRAALPWPRVASGQERGKGSECTLTGMPTAGGAADCSR